MCCIYIQMLPPKVRHLIDTSTSESRKLIKPKTSQVDEEKLLRQAMLKLK